MKGTLTSNPDLFSEYSWDLLLLGEDMAKKWGHSELNIEHIIQTLFTSAKFATFIENLSIDQNIVLDITEDFLEENPVDEFSRLTIGEELEVLLDNANLIKVQWGSNLIEIPHLLIAIARDERLGYFVFEEGNLSVDKLEAELKLRPNIIPKRNNISELKKINPNNDLVIDEPFEEKGPEISQSEINQIITDMKDSNKNESQENIVVESALSLYGKDLTNIAAQGLLDPVIGRENEINNLMRVLSRRNKNSPILIGNPGVGKTAIVQLLVQLINKKRVPDSLKNVRIIALDFGALVSGTKFRGQLEERLRLVIDELKDSEQGLILFIDEIHTIIKSDRSTVDIGSILKPLLTEGDLRCIGTTTPDRFRESIEKDQALNRCFQKIFVNEPSLALSSEILLGIKNKYEIHHGIKISKEALDYSAKLADRYISDKCLPDKAIDLIDEAAAQLKIESSLPPESILLEEEEIEELNNKLNNLSTEEVEIREKLYEEKETRLENLAFINENWAIQRQELEELINLIKKEEYLKKEIEKNNFDNPDETSNEIELSETREAIEILEKNFRNSKEKGDLFIKYIVEPDHIADVISKTTGIPISKVVSSERKKLINLEKEISQKVIGQEQAISVISSAIRRARTGMKNPTRPVGSFLFMGPTGVGKTELAKSLATTLFDEEGALLRLDMSEYMERNAVARLLGAPPGYIGYEEGGQLTEAIRRKPYSVILLDEIEKAHKEVFNILLQVLDEGRLTDSQGRTVDFKNTVIIMTSNLAGNVILESSKELVDNEMNSQSIDTSLNESIDKSLKATFRPEFLNRIDEIIRFLPLTIEELKKIIILQIEDLKKLLLEQEISIDIDKKVICKIADDAYEPLYGARPLARELRRQIENPLAAKLLQNNFKNKKKITIKLDPSKKDVILFRASS